MIRQFNGFDRNNVYGEYEKLPVGGYVIGILDAEIQTIPSTGNQFLLLKFDIAEGEYKNYYSKQYKESSLPDKKFKGVFRLYIPKDDGSDMDEFTKKKFNTAIYAVEDSNINYHWDWNEKSLIGKKVGCIMYKKEWEYNGKTGFATAPYGFRSVNDIEDGNFKIPKPKKLQKAAEFEKVDLSDYTEILADDPF